MPKSARIKFEMYKSEILCRYQVMKMDDVRRTMKEEYDFVASKRSYDYAIQRWKVQKGPRRKGYGQVPWNGPVRATLRSSSNLKTSEDRIPSPSSTDGQTEVLSAESDLLQSVKTNVEFDERKRQLEVLHGKTFDLRLDHIGLKIPQFENLQDEDLHLWNASSRHIRDENTVSRTALLRTTLLENDISATALRNDAQINNAAMEGAQLEETLEQYTQFADDSMKLTCSSNFQSWNIQKLCCFNTTIVQSEEARIETSHEVVQVDAVGANPNQSGIVQWERSELMPDTFDLRGIHIHDFPCADSFAGNSPIEIAKTATIHVDSPSLHGLTRSAFDSPEFGFMLVHSEPSYATTLRSQGGSYSTIGFSSPHISPLTADDWSMMEPNWSGLLDPLTDVEMFIEGSWYNSDRFPWLPQQ